LNHHFKTTIVPEVLFSNLGYWHNKLEFIF